MNNFNTLIAIVAGLQLSAVSRLKAAKKVMKLEVSKNSCL
jgi:hypothetical protein